MSSARLASIQESLRKCECKFPRQRKVGSDSTFARTACAGTRTRRRGIRSQHLAQQVAHPLPVAALPVDALASRADPKAFVRRRDGVRQTVHDLSLLDPSQRQIAVKTEREG